jgi:hypothetical protein
VRTIAVARFCASFLIAWLGFSHGASAQGLAVRGGANVDPVQVYGGIQYSFFPVWESLRPTPSVDFGAGSGAPRVAVYLDALLHSRPLGRQAGWNLLVGGGPAVNRYYQPPGSTTALGLSAVGTLNHASGWFGEVRLGFFDGARARVSLGYRLAGGDTASRRGRP